MTKTIIPTLFTLGNAVCGFAAIAHAGKIDGTEATAGYFAVSGWLILAAMVFDALDGSVARLYKSSSDFGGELDSLCDAVSFGVAPAFLLLRLGPGWDYPIWHQVLAAVATLYVMCVVVRLARFNVENSPDPAYHKRFKGLPSPAAAGCLASLAILRGQLGDRWPSLDTTPVHNALEAWATLGAFLVALLMISQVPYPHATKHLGRGLRRLRTMLQIVLAGAVVVLLQELAVVVLFWSYALVFLVRYLLARGLHRLPATRLEDALRR